MTDTQSHNEISPDEVDTHSQLVYYHSAHVESDPNAVARFHTAESPQNQVSGHPAIELHEGYFHTGKNNPANHMDQ